MSTRILLLLTGAAALAMAFNSDHLNNAIVTSEFGGVPYKYQCRFIVPNVWNDIIFLIDMSGSYGEFNELYYTMSEIMQPFTVNNTNQASVRFGITFFNSDVSLAGPFGQILKSNISQINTFNYYNSTNKVSNIDKALNSAANQFANTDRHARRVIVLMTQNVMYTSTKADSMKGFGYIINVYSLQNPAAPPKTSNIQKLASPGYFTNSITNTPADLQKLQAKANCFCPMFSDSYTTDATGAPTGGCYLFSGTNNMANYAAAVNGCANGFNGTLATDQTPEKTIFINKEFNNTDGLIGLKWNGEVWMWSDGTELDDGDYNLFPKNTIPTPTGDNQCVYLSGNQWIQTSCRISNNYLCEFEPCDTNNVCE